MYDLAFGDHHIHWMLYEFELHCTVAKNDATYCKELESQSTEIWIFNKIVSLRHVCKNLLYTSLHKLYSDVMISHSIYRWYTGYSLILVSHPWGTSLIKNNEQCKYCMSLQLITNYIIHIVNRTSDKVWSGNVWFCMWNLLFPTKQWKSWA